MKIGDRVRHRAKVGGREVTWPEIRMILGPGKPGYWIISGIYGPPEEFLESELIPLVGETKPKEPEPVKPTAPKLVFGDDAMIRKARGKK